ncbi:MAG TPA: tyrosinase family protein [Thermoanaerobaculia bacterium]|nr:tyrosinase family protein [Thermoanaerobaculia bacterium]
MRPRLRTIVLAILVTAISVPLFAQQQGVRMNWQTFIQDPARVQSLRNAVAVMKSRNSADPKSAVYRTSWEYWGAMHGYFGPGSVFGTVEQAIAQYNSSGGDPLLLPLYNGIKDTAPPDAIAQQVWGQCQHGTPWFFAWHRLYLYYFEQVLQKAANDPNLRLPYWDYTDPANLAMPAPYSTPTYFDGQGHIEANALNEPRRTPGWNPPGGNLLDATSTNINDALKDKTFFDTPTGTGYQSDIEGNVHGYVHCTVVPCPGPDMGAVGYSANDPIFWAHHANIDRMWDCWTSLGNKNPTDASYLNKTFSFVDADGNLVTNAVADLFNGKIKFTYVYQQASNCARPVTTLEAVPAPSANLSPSALEAARTKLAEPAVLAAVKNHVINAEVTRRKLTLAGGQLESVRSVAVRGNDALPVETELVLRNIQFDSHPGSQFNVILERRDDATKRVRVGTLSFFVSTNPHEGHSGAINRTFDVTDELRQIGASSADLKDLNVVFEATTGRAGATESSFDANDAKVTIGEIELRVKATE